MPSMELKVLLVKAVSSGLNWTSANKIQQPKNSHLLTINKQKFSFQKK